MEFLPMIRKNALQSCYIYHFSLKSIHLIIWTNFNTYKCNRIGGEKSYINKIIARFSDKKKSIQNFELTFKNSHHFIIKFCCSLFAAKLLMSGDKLVVVKFCKLPFFNHYFCLCLITLITENGGSQMYVLANQYKYFYTKFLKFEKLSQGRMHQNSITSFPLGTA